MPGFNFRRLVGLEDGVSFKYRVNGSRSEASALLPRHRDDLLSALPAKEVTEVALKLKYLIEQTIPVEFKETQLTRPNSDVITHGVVRCAKEACGGNESLRACLVFGLMTCKRWFRRQAKLELWDAELHDLRIVACEVLAKKLIEMEEDEAYLFQEVLLKRYSIIRGGQDSTPTNVIEMAVDLHSTRVIGSSGYQRCIKYLWRGWLIQDEDRTSTFVAYKERGNDSYWAHFHPDRMRAPAYQNALQILISLIYLAMYTGAINTINPTGDLDIVEGVLYIFTLGFICDEMIKFWKVGRHYFGFWNAFNSTLYGLLTVSFVTRLIALSYPPGDDTGHREHFNQLSYNFLAFTAPMFWIRIGLYLDSFRFIGTMLVVLKQMMKESLIFFALLIIVILGFVQGFIGLDGSDNSVDSIKFILTSMTKAILQAPEFEGFDTFAPPFGIILYYLFTFITMVILLNILIALYNTAYSDITENSLDEYMALFSQKTMQFVRAPDENVFIAPFNLIEIFLLVLPLQWWMSKQHYRKLNDYVMGIVYAPFLVLVAALESRDARHVNFNRQRGEVDDDTTEEWEEMEDELDLRRSGWVKRCDEMSPDASSELKLIRELREEIKELNGKVDEMKQKKN